MIRHAVLTAVAVAAISLAVLSSPVQAQDEPPPARTTEDLLDAIEAVRAKLRALDEPADIRTSAEQKLAAWVHPAAEQGHAEAQFYLGVMYATGRGVPQNDAKAVAWFRLAAEQSHAGAQRNLGMMYHDGRGVPQNDAEAVTWYRLAAAQGHAEGQYAIGMMYTTGRGVPQNDAEAVIWFRRAAAQGHAWAQTTLGGMYLNGRGCRRMMPKPSPGGAKPPSRATPGRWLPSGQVTTPVVASHRTTSKLTRG